MVVIDIFKIEFKKIFKQKKTYIIWVFMIGILLTSMNSNLLDMDHIESLQLDDSHNLEQEMDSLKSLEDVLNSDTLDNSGKESLNY